MNGATNCHACDTGCVERYLPIDGAMRGSVGGFDFSTTGIPPTMILLCPACTTQALAAVGIDIVERTRIDRLKTERFLAHACRQQRGSTSAVTQTENAHDVVITSEGGQEPLCAVATTRTFVHKAEDDINVYYLDIHNGEDWSIKDIRIRGKTIYSQPGAVPGDMFSSAVIDSFLDWPSIKAGDEVAIDVEYIGLSTASLFRCTLVHVLDRTTVQ